MTRRSHVERVEHGTETPARRTRTGDRVRQLVEDVKDDLSDIEALLARARTLAERLEEDGRGINGLSAACRGWGQHLDKMLEDITDERDEVERTMLGTRRPGAKISQRVDETLRQEIVLARGA